MTNHVSKHEFPPPIVDPNEYRPNFRLVRAAFLIPVPFLVIDLVAKGASWFAPSGALVTFVVLFVQLRQLSRLQVKHLRNAEAAAKHQQILGLSDLYKALDKAVFWAALYGTGVWAYGDKLVRLLLRWIAA